MPAEGHNQNSPDTVSPLELSNLGSTTMVPEKGNNAEAQNKNFKIVIINMVKDLRRT